MSAPPDQARLRHVSERAAEITRYMASSDGMVRVKAFSVRINCQFCGEENNPGLGLKLRGGSSDLINPSIALSMTCTSCSKQMFEVHDSFGKVKLLVLTD